jgi:chromosome partitioning protein
MKVVTLLNEKGGVGKTTLATAIGCGLAIRGWRVVLLDADAQANLTMAVGLAPTPGFYNLIVRDAPFSEVLKFISPETYEVPGQPVNGFLYAVPSNRETQAISQSTDNVLAVRDALAKLADQVDVVLIDTPPTPSLLHASIYLATDYLLFPVELEYFSFTGLGSSLGNRNISNLRRKEIGLANTEIMGIIPNKVRLNTLEHQENLERLRGQFKELVWPELPLRIIWGEAAARRLSVFNYAPDSAASREAWGVVDRVEGILQHVQP